MVIFKGNRFHEKVFFDTKIYQKEQNLYAYIPQKSFHRKHTSKNYVLNKLKRYVKYNSEKLGFLKLRNKFFDRLRNRGFRKFSFAKMFSAVSYMARDKYLSSKDKIYSAVVQETQVEMALDEVAEGIFQDHLKPDQNKRKKSGLQARKGSFLQQIRLCLFKQLWVKQQNRKKDYSLGFVFPGNCVEIHREIKQIFNEEMEKSCKTSPAFFSLLPELCVWCSIPQRKKSLE